MDRRDKLLSHFLSQAGRKDLIQLDGDEAIFQYLTALLNPRTPLKLNDSRPRWAKRVEMRYSEQPPQLDIICFTFALRHFSPDFIEILNHGVPQKALLLIQRTIASIFRPNKAFMAQDGSSVLKVLPWGDIAQYVSQSDWKLGSKFIDGKSSI